MTFLLVREHGNSIKFHKYFDITTQAKHSSSTLFSFIHCISTFKALRSEPKRIMNLHMLTFSVNIYIFWHLRHTLQTMIQHIYNTLPLKCTNIVQVLSWNLQYDTRWASMQRNLLKERTQLVEAKLANSKWTNYQPCTVWCLGFAVSVLSTWSSLAVLHIVVVFHRKYCDKRAQPKFSCFPRFFVSLIKLPSFSVRTVFWSFSRSPGSRKNHEIIWKDHEVTVILCPALHSKAKPYDNKWQNVKPMSTRNIVSEIIAPGGLMFTVNQIWL